MPKSLPKTSLLNLSVEEENLAAIPFAVLERRVGKRIGKLDISGRKLLPDGTELQVTWQIQGNSELGLPTEQDLDIFVALGVLTFRANFSKTVSFSGREIARILNIGTVHGKFYKRLKLAMDRFIPLRFRALTATDTQEEVKWLNVFQEASFSLDRPSGRCIGSVTWTDKLIQSMDSGFFRVLNAGRYMELDGITAKHLYRFMAVAFEKTDVVVIDARQLSTEHLGIVNPPKYLSRLMQTLEPAFEQLQRIEVLGSYTLVNNGKLALRRHPSYVPERKTLQLSAVELDPEFARDKAQLALLGAGLPSRTTQRYADGAVTREDFYQLERAARILEGLVAEEVLEHVAISLVRRALDVPAELREQLDLCELALEVCRQKKQAGQAMRNAPGLLVKIIKDAETRGRVVSEDLEASLRESFRRREAAARRQLAEAEERTSIIEYESFKERLAQSAYDELPESKRAALVREKEEVLRGQQRYQRLAPEVQRREAEQLVMQELARKEAPAYERWRIRRVAQQAVLPFSAAS
ncbi:MAG: hypothetical protein ACRD96_28410 [Bryobacteraceae bacterium]